MAWLDACGSADNQDKIQTHWSRELQALGLTVLLMPRAVTHLCTRGVPARSNCPEPQKTSEVDTAIQTKTGLIASSVAELMASSSLANPHST